jgi:hypothetical protein
MKVETPRNRYPASAIVSALIALALNSCDAFVLGQGFFAAFISFIVGCVYLLTARGERMRRRLALAGIWAGVGAIAIVAHVVDIRGARGRAEIVVKACRAYELRHGRLPNELDELVPGFLPSIPRGRRLGIMGKLSYHNWKNQHNLMYVVFPPFARRTFTFEENRWNSLD